MTPKIFATENFIIQEILLLKSEKIIYKTLIMMIFLMKLL